jgi:protein TonB
MYSTTAPLSLPLSHPNRVQATNPKLPGRIGIAIAVLLHVIVLAIALHQVTPPPLKLPEPPAMLTVFSIPADMVSAQINVAAPTPVAPPQQLEKPVVKPRPKPKLKPVEKPLVAATKPTPAPMTQVAPAPPAPAEPVAVATPPPPPQTLTSAASTATVTSAPTAMQGIAGPKPMLSPEDTDRLARQYAGVVSRMISSSQKWPLMSKQMGEVGTAMVRLKIARDGRVVDAQLIRPTGYARLDEEARAVVLRIGRFMPVPSRLRPNDEFLLLDQPMRFGPA